MLNAFSSFLLFSLVFNYITKPYLTKQTSWYLLHIICNTLVIITTFDDVVCCFSNPINSIKHGNNINEFNSDGLGIAIGLHMFHIVRDFKTLTILEWIHHIISNLLLGLIGIYYFHNVVFNCGLFFMCGLPGGIDYFLLFLCKINKFEKIEEKKINVFLNNWIRSPGILYSVFLMHFGYIAEYIVIPVYVYYIGQFFTALNAIYFAQRVTLNYGCYLD